MDGNGFARVGIKNKKIYKNFRSDDGLCELLEVSIGVPELYLPEKEEEQNTYFISMNSFFDRFAEGCLSYLENKLLSKIKSEYDAVGETRLRRRFGTLNAALKYSFAEAAVVSRNEKKTGIILSFCMDIIICRQRKILDCRRQSVNFFIPDKSSDGILISPEKAIKMLLVPEILKQTRRKYDGIYLSRNPNGACDIHVYKNLTPDRDNKKLQITDFVSDGIVFSGE